MKIIWEADDIEAGLRVRAPGCRETWMVGYDPSPGSVPSARCSVVSLSDGMISRSGLSLQQVAEHFNACGVHPVSLVGECDAP